MRIFGGDVPPDILIAGGVPPPSPAFDAHDILAIYSNFLSFQMLSHYLSMANFMIKTLNGPHISTGADPGGI